MTTFLENALYFPQMLRRAGLTVTTEQCIDFVRALEMVDIGNREQVYHAARSMFVNRQEHLRLFETLFNLFWRAQGERSRLGGQKAPVAPRHDQKREQGLNMISYMAFKARHGDPEIDVADKTGTYSDLELLSRKDFAEMTPEELETIKGLIRAMRWQISLRRTRRRVPDKNGTRLYMRGVMRSAVRSGGIPLSLRWQRRKIKPRPLVLIADISGSMEKYARLVLQLFYSVSHSLKDAECFVFGTRLTRITPQLKIKNIDRAVSDAAREVMDWSGGTRIGESLRAFNHDWSRRVLRRGAILLIVSDGWERGDAALLKKEMRYLQKRCHRLIWLNPHQGRTGYEPLVEGMAAALPYIDHFLPCQNLQNLAEFGEIIEKIGN